MRKSLAVILVAAVAGCTLVAHHELNDRFGPADPARFDQPAKPVDQATWEKADQVFAGRCVVCHACWDAPCQLKLTSWDGVARGGTLEDVYGMRLRLAEPTRLGIDALRASEWRARGFHAVLNERKATPETNRELSVMQRLLDLKRRHAPES